MFWSVGSGWNAEPAEPTLGSQTPTALDSWGARNSRGAPRGDAPAGSPAARRRPHGRPRSRVRSVPAASHGSRSLRGASAGACCPPPLRDRPPRPAAECPGAVSRAPADRGRIAKPRATEFRTITTYVAMGKVAPNGPLRRGRNRAGADSGLDVRPAWRLGHPSRPKVLVLEALFVWAFLF